MKREELSVGMEVLLSGTTRGRLVPGTVDKIGRTIVYIRREGWSGGTPYYIGTQTEKVAMGAGAFWTPQQVAALEHRDELVKRLKAHGLEFVGYGRAERDWSTDALDALIVTADAMHEIAS